MCQYGSCWRCKYYALSKRGGGAQTDPSINSIRYSGRYVPVLRKFTYNPCLENNLLGYPKIRLPKIELH